VACHRRVFDPGRGPAAPCVVRTEHRTRRRGAEVRPGRPGRIQSRRCTDHRAKPGREPSRPFGQTGMVDALSRRAGTKHAKEPAMSGQAATRTEDVRMFEPDVEAMPRKSLRDLQVARLRQTLSNAYANVPHYRRKFDEAGVSPA